MKAATREQTDRRPDIMGYEPSDVSARFLLLTGIGLFAGVALSILIAFGILLAAEPARQTPPTPFTAQPRGGPRLEVSPSAERAGVQAAAQSRLEHYGWNDRSETAHIPIDRAMAILAERGWPDQNDRRRGNP